MGELKYLRIPIPFIGLLLIQPNCTLSVLYYCIYFEAMSMHERNRKKVDYCFDTVVKGLELSEFGLGEVEIETAKKTYDFYEGVKTDIWAYCSVERFVCFLKKTMNSNIPDFEVNQFCCFLAMKSIEGNKNYGIATKKMILTRMLGLDKSEKLKDSFLSRSKRIEIKERYAKISTIRKFRAIIDAVSTYGYFTSVVACPHIGYIFSTSLGVKDLAMTYRNDKEFAKRRVEYDSKKFREEIKKNR